jgi:hypothetical protein
LRREGLLLKSQPRIMGITCMAGPYSAHGQRHDADGNQRGPGQAERAIALGR